MKSVIFPTTHRNDIRCPICQCDLIPDAVHVVCGVIFCEPCTSQFRRSIFAREIAYAYSTRSASYFIDHAGLKMYCPDRYELRSMTACLLALYRGLVDGNDLQAVSFVHGITGKRGDNVTEANCHSA